MKPRVRLAESKPAGGGTMVLYEHDGSFSISFNGEELMQSRATTSEILLGQLGVERLDRSVTTRVLIGGLGLGFTLKSVLESVGPATKVDVAELVPEVIEWNRAYLKQLNGILLEDPRVTVLTEDVSRVIRQTPPGAFDVILLDVDNGPIAMVAKSNSTLYSNAGIRAIRSALKPGGRAVFWSAGKDKKFEARLGMAGFTVKAVAAKRYDSAKRAACTLYVADPD